jgi:hypothetical protein
MNFARIAPCEDCPFLVKGGIRLTKERIGEIAQALLVEPGSSFPCHKTVNYGRRNRRTESACPGSLLFQENIQSSTQWRQLAERIGGLRPERLKGHARVFRSLAAWLSTAIR